MFQEVTWKYCNETKRQRFENKNYLNKLFIHNSKLMLSRRFTNISRIHGIPVQNTSTY